MQEHIEFNPSYSLLTMACNPGEAINVEPGAMVSMSGMSMQTGMSGGGGFGGGSRGGYGSRDGGSSGGYGGGGDKVVSDNQIYVTGLPTNLTEEDIASFFGSIGVIKNDK